jgi:protoporphyrinogen oxidase
MIINNTSDTQPGAIVILGAGITGLVLARQLSAHFGNRVIVVEKEDHIGGMASTRSYKGMRYDVGSHRIHPDFLPRALEYLTQDLDVRILEKRRNGKMYFRGKFVRYPPVPLDIIRNMSIAECRELALCYLRAFPLPIRTMQSYEEVVVHRAGKRMHPDFYTECALKLWGVHPGDMSVDSLKRRKTVFDRTSLMRFFFRQNPKVFLPGKRYRDCCRECRRGSVEKRGIALQKQLD